MKWERNIGKYVWSVVFLGERVFVGSNVGIYVFKFDGIFLWKKVFNGVVRKIVFFKNGIVVFVVL